MRLYSLIHNGFKELCFGAQASSSSVPVVLCDDLTVSGGKLNAPVLDTELLTNRVSGWYDAKNFRSVAFQIQTDADVTAGEITFEQTNDITISPNGNFLQVFDLTSVNTNPFTYITLAGNATRLFAASVTARYVRVRVTSAFVGGYVSASAVFSQQPYSNPVLNIQQSNGANLQVAARLAAGASLAADVGLQARATTGGVSTVGRLLSSAATTNATSLKASAGRLFKIRGLNNAAFIRYLKLYNKASAPNVGTDVPVITIPLKASADFDIDLGVYGHFFSTGIAYAITGAVADADTTAIAAADILGLNAWYA